jgi:hypothetical protein
MGSRGRETDPDGFGTLDGGNMPIAVVHAPLGSPPCWSPEMTTNRPPQGARFSHVYLDRGEPTQDSERMRRRMAALVHDFRDLKDLDDAVPVQLGVAVPSWGPGGPNWKEFFDQCALRDVLDIVTVAFQVLTTRQTTGFYERDAQVRWVKEVRRIFAEENVHYTVDDHGGVHFHFDEEFARNRAATVATLEDARYANALHAFEGAMAALAKAPPDGKAAIRGVFSAVENIFRLILPNAPRLGAAELGGLAVPLQQIYAGDETARRSSAKMLSGLKDWVDGAHFFRHEQGAEEVVQPPLRLAIYIVSLGASHLRWLAEIDDSLRP